MGDIKRMDVHEALDKAREEKQRLEEEVRTKTDLYNNLRKAQQELVTKFQETKLQSEKQAKELNAKSEEMISKLEEKLQDVEEQLKWKNEQFEHLEEAHERLQENFQNSKSEWEKEKSLLLEEINSVQKSLDSQIRISETLQTQLKICNQALAHEESTRKLLEVEVSEYKSRFDNIFLECNEAKLTIEKLSHKRDEEVASLRDNLATKDSLFKEMGYKMAHLEQENQDLTSSLKEFQESVIVKSGQNGLLKKVQKKYQDLEHVHKKCLENLKGKEVEWKSQLEKSKKEMDVYVSKLEVQDEKVKKLQEELENFENQNHKDGFDDLSRKIVELERENQSHLCKANEQNEKIVDLEQQLVLLETMVTEKTKTIEEQNQEKEKYFKTVKDKESNIENLLSGFEQEKKSLLEVIEVRNNKIKELTEEVTNAFKNSEELKIENQNHKDGFDDLSHKFVELEKENQSHLCKANEQNEKIIDLERQLVLLETMVTERTKEIEEQKEEKEKYFRVIQDKESNIENMVTGFEQEKKSLLEVIEVRNKKIEELIEEVTNALRNSEELKIENDVTHHALEKMKIEYSDLTEKMKVKDDLSHKFVELEKENQGHLCKANEQKEKIVDLERQIFLLETMVTERTKTLEEQKEEKEKCFKVIKDKESNIENLLIGFEQEKKSLLEVIEVRNKKIEELIEEVTNALKNSEELKIENDVIHHALEKMKIENSDLSEKMKVKDDLSHKFVELEKENQSHLCKANEQNEKIVDLEKQLVLLETMVTERTKTIEEQKEEKEKYFKVIQDKESNMENLLSGFEQEKKSLLEVIEVRNKKIEELIEEMTNVIKNSEELKIALRKMENEVFDLSEKMKVKDELLLQASKREDEQQGLMGIKELSKQNEIDVMNQSLKKMEIEVSDLCEKMKLKDDLIGEMTNALKNSEELKIENDVMQHALEKREIEVSDLNEKMKLKDELLLQASKREEEQQGLMGIKELEKTIEIDDMNKALKKMKIEVSDLNEKMKLKDELLFQASKHAQELEKLVEIKKLEIEKVKKQFGDEKRELEVEKIGLREHIKKLLSEREDLIIQMGKMSERIGEFSRDDELLMGMLDNMLEKCTG